MATLTNLSTDVQLALVPDLLIGRGDECGITVALPNVSMHHARLRWTNSAWHLRDLGSQNGTFVNRRPIAAGEEVRLHRDDVIGLAEATPVWILSDDSPPKSRAILAGSDDERVIEHGLLLLPDADAPLLTVFQDSGGAWQAETESVVFSVQDGQSVTVAGRQWTLALNPEVQRTVEAEAGGAAISDVELHFAVSQAEERVQLEILTSGRRLEVPERKSHYMLLLLARQRLRDRAAGHQESECGWLDRTELYRMLRTDRESLNKDVSRVRKQFAQLGVVGARDLIDVWGDSRRIGVERLAIR